MIRISTICVIALALTSIAVAAPPTEKNWSDQISRYAGQYHLHADGSDAPLYQFSFKWADSGKVAQYTNRSIGDTPFSWSTGFCFWNPKNNRIEFNEIEYGDEGRMSVDGFCVNSSENTMTWIVTFWTSEGVVRRMAMADTFTKTGISRSITLLDGKPLPTEIVEWVKVK